MDLVECRVQFLQLNILKHQHTLGWVIYLAVKCFQFNYKSEKIVKMPISGVMTRY